MRFMRNLFMTLLWVVLAVSAVVFAVSYSLLSAASPSLIMTVVQEAGGTEKIVKQVAEYAAPHFTDDPKLQEAIIETAQKIVRPEVVRDLVSDAMAGAKRFIESGGTDTSATLDLRPLKANILAEAKKSLPEYLDYIEEALESMPDRPELSRLLPLPDAESMGEIVRPYRLAANLPLVSAIVAATCVGLMAIILGWRGGIKLGGSCLLAVGVLVLIVTFVAKGSLLPRLLESIPTTMYKGELPVQVNPRALASAALGFVIGRAMLVGGLSLALGSASALIPKRKAAAPAA